MKSPATFLQRISMSYELGQPCAKPQSLRDSQMSVNRVLKNNLISSSTEERSTSWSLNTSVIGRRDCNRNPERIRGSGRPVMKNLTLVIFPMYRESTERMADAGSSSRHSSRASMIITVEIRVALKGLTMSFSICEQRDSRPASGFTLNTRSNCSRNEGYR